MLKRSHIDDIGDVIKKLGLNCEKLSPEIINKIYSSLNQNLFSGIPI